MLANVARVRRRAFYDVYAAGEARHDLSPLADQNTAGAIMMVEGSILTIVPVRLAVPAGGARGRGAPGAARPAGARGVELSERRAARAVAAGRGAELRRRLESGEPTGGTAG